MENNKKEIIQRKCIFSKSIDIDLDYQENLEPYNDEMLKIMRSSVYNSIVNYDYNNGLLTVHGKSKFQIAYFNNNDKKLSAAEFDEEFERNINVDGDYDDITFDIRMVDKYSNARIINPTRLDIHNSFCLLVKAYIKETLSVISENKNTVLRERELGNVSQIAFALTKSEFEDEATISADSSSVNKIINVFSTASVEETKIVENKMLVKSKVGISALYISEDNSYVKIEKIISINTILDMQGIADGDFAFVDLNTAGIYLKPKSDKNNEYRSIEIIGELSVSAAVYRESKLTLPVDAYSVENNVILSTTPIDINTNSKIISDSLNTKIIISTEKQNISEVLDLSAKINPDGLAEINAIISDENGNLSVLTSKQSIDIPQGEDLSIYITGFDFVIISENEIEVRINVNYTALSFTEQTVNAVSEIKTINNDTVQTPALSVYFAQNGEELWDIAKKFRTSVDIIKKENDIVKDVIDSKRILIISGM